jgi:MFS family permease
VTQAAADPGVIDSPAAWRRLAAAMLMSTLGGVGMWSYVVALPAVQGDFGIDRAAASVPYTATMIGFALGGVLMGKLADRFGVVVPVVIGIVTMAAGYLLAAQAANVTQLALVHGTLIAAAGSAATFGPLIADVSHWFMQRRGLAVAIAAAGNYVAGTLWPPAIQFLIEAYGWRATHVGIAIFCLATMLPLAFALRRRAPAHAASAASDSTAEAARPLGLAPNTLLALLVAAGIACCVAMSMPQVHIVALCGDLGYGAAAGAQMLALMLGFGIVSRLASGFIADRIGGLRTLLLGSVLQGIALLLYLPSDSLWSLYVVSALFGLFQGGIVPSYAIIVREFFPPSQAGTKVGIVLMATLGGMALGGWLSGKVFDLTGSYSAAFVNGIGWNLLNVAIALWLLARSRRHAVADARRFAAP